MGKRGLLPHAEQPGYVPETHDGLIDLSNVICFFGPDRRLGIVVAGVLIYLFGLLCFFPDVITLNDEQRYLEAAYAFSKASLCLDQIDPLSGAMACRQSRSYLPGTSALLAALYLLFGYIGWTSGPRYFAPLTPLLAFAAAVTPPEPDGPTPFDTMMCVERVTLSRKVVRSGWRPSLLSVSITVR